MGQNPARAPSPDLLQSLSHGVAPCCAPGCCAGRQRPWSDTENGPVHGSGAPVSVFGFGQILNQKVDGNLYLHQPVLGLLIDQIGPGSLVSGQSKRCIFQLYRDQPLFGDLLFDSPARDQRQSVPGLGFGDQFLAKIANESRVCVDL